MKKTFLTFLIFFTFLVPMLPDITLRGQVCVGMFTDYAYAERGVTVKPKQGASPQMAANAKYYAIIIGNNSYKNLPKLKTAINDAKEVERILKSQYGFETKLLIDATRNEILTGINDFRKILGQNDNFLIYYAGHGEFDKTADKSYWLPVDAQNDNPANWIIADDITSNIKRIASKHILLVSDSCYSGTLTRAVSTDLSTKSGREEFINKMMDRPSRTLMASGGNEPVADSGGGNNSVFAAAFLKALKEADKPLFTAEELFHGRVKEIVAGKSEQVPEYNNIKNSGHEGGDFVFQVKTASLGAVTTPEPAKPLSAEVSDEMKKLQEEKERLKSEREELEQKKALMEEKNRLEEERRKLEKEKLEVASLSPPPQIKTPPLTKGDEGGFNMVLIPAGEFMAGDPDSLEGMVINAFYMDKYKVTQREFQQVMGNNPSYFKGCDNCPVESVTWDEADEYCEKVGKRLPTEWEWEKAAKAGTTTTYYWGESEGMAGDYAWYDKNSDDKTHPVGQKKPNGYGLYDMGGNVEEWTSTDYDDSGEMKTLRGWSWDAGTYLIGSSMRAGSPPATRGYNTGFRCSQ